MRAIPRFLAIALAVLPMPAFAGEAATIIFSSGASVKINNGYSQLATELKAFNKVNSGGGDSYIAEINIEGSTFFINVAEVALICRDAC